MKTIILFLLFIASNFISAQPSIQWQKSLGGSSSDVAFSIKQTSDNGYIVAGYTQSNDSDVTVYHGNQDYWIVKLNSVGSIEWQKSLGGTDVDMLSEIHQTSDGGYIIGGYSISDDIDITGNHGQEDYWIVKINNLGTIQWQKSLGGSNIERAYSIKPTTSGGYIVAGSTNSTDGDITFHHGGINIQHDFWIVNLDSTGNILWQKCLGGSSTDVARSVQQTSDGGFIVAGQTSSNDGDVTGLHGTPAAQSDFWIVKINNVGDIQWQKALGGTRDDMANSIQQTSDGGYIIAGDSRSSDGDVSLHWGSFVDNDIWVVKTDSAGNIVWEKTFGGTSTDMVHFIRQTVDGGYVVAGYTGSNDGDLTGLHGLSIDYDYWIFKLNDSGIIQWQKVIGGTGNDVARCIQQTNDDGYIIAGSSNSTNGNVTGNNGSGDYWVVKLSAFVSVNEIQNSISNFQLSPNPVSESTKISFQLSHSENVSMKIYELEGRLIRNLNIENIKYGKNEILWDTMDDLGNKVVPGVYLLTVGSDKFFESKKVIILGN